MNNILVNILIRDCKEDCSEYLNLIETALSENRVKSKLNYYEKHHILPKSLYREYENDKSNIVLLTPYEHVLAHKILYKILPSEEMSFAYSFVAGLFKDENYLTPEEYNSIMTEKNILLSKKLTGVKKSEQHKKHISEGKTGLSLGPLSEEHKQKISKALTGNVVISEANRRACSERMKNLTGAKNPRSKRILCVEDNLIFDTVGDCCRYYHTSNLYRYTKTGKMNKRLQKHFIELPKDDIGE